MDTDKRLTPPTPLREVPAHGPPPPPLPPGNVISETPVVSPRRKSRRPLYVVGALLVLATLVLIVYAFVGAGKEGTDDAQVSADVVPVGSRVPGQVVHVRVSENQLVKRGEVLVELDEADYAARVRQSEAEVETTAAQAAAADAQVRVVEAASKGGFASARALVSGSSLGVASADAQIAAARATVLRAQADVHKAELDLRRARDLRTANAVPQQTLDNAQVGYDSAQAQLAQARAQLTAAEEAKQVAQSRVTEARGRAEQSTPVDAQIAGARAQADLAHARQKSAQAQLELARLQLGYAKIVAPADGIASRLSVHEGQLVQQGQPVIELVPSQTYVVANFKETQLGKMRPGQEADVEIDAFPGRTFHARVESISGGTGATFSLMPADNASGNFVKVVQRVPVRLAWVDPPSDVTLRAGLSADVTVRVGR